MIPKKIHYCWFGRNPMPEKYVKYIESWKKKFKDYEIIEWNESNFDINSNLYIQQAYKAKKWAFVSDFARFKILYEQGGIYFDTDVEVIKDMTEIIQRGPFMGTEIKVLGEKKQYYYVAPGLGLAAEAGMPFLKELIDEYNKLEFFNEDGSLNQTTIVKYTTDLLCKKGYDITKNEIQNVAGFLVYPPEYFNPLDEKNGKLNITKHTYSIHWYAASWHTSSEKRKNLLKKLLGEKITHFIVQIKRRILKNG